MKGPAPTIVRGDIFNTTYGRCRVLTYVSALQIKVKFIKTGYVCWVHSSNLRKGQVKDLLLPNVAGVGFLGGVTYSVSEHRRLYCIWCAILYRCYKTEVKKKHPTYKECRVSKRWHNFQNFMSDIKRLSNCDTPGFELDKDLRVWGNKVYGRKYCSFVPKSLNSFFTGGYVGKNGQGVTKNRHRFYVTVSGVKNKSFLTAKDAEEFYLEAKIKLTRQLAKKYKTDVHPEVYSLLMSLTTEDIKWVSNV